MTIESKPGQVLVDASLLGRDVKKAIKCEREAIAKMADKWVVRGQRCTELAAAIRARGGQ